MSLTADEPPVLPIGTDVSAKYKGAFCEAKIKRLTRAVKCKLTLKHNNNTVTLDDDAIVTGQLRTGAHVTVRYGGGGGGSAAGGAGADATCEATIAKILDQSLYTVVFDDGDEATLKRNSLCLKSGKHFAESETLDQLPLTNPEHFGNPVSLGRRRRRRHHNNSDSDDDEADDRSVTDSHRSSKRGGGGGGPPVLTPSERDTDWGRVVCVDYSDKRGSKKDVWFPALIVAPTAQQPTAKVARDEHLVRSFRDGRFYKVPKRETREFARELVLSKSEANSVALRSAVEKAVTFVDKQDLPNGWDYDLLLGNTVPQLEEEVETSEEFDSALDDSDDEQSEEKDRFVAQLYKYMDERGTPINRAPSVGGRDLNLYKLYRIVVKMGGYNRVTNKNSWRAVYGKLGLPGGHSAPGKESSAVYQLKAAYKKFLHSFDDFYRKLGCTITVNSRTSRPSRGERSRGGGPVEDKPTPQSTPVAVSATTSSSSAKKSNKRDAKKEDNTKEERESKEKDSVAAGALESVSSANTTPSKTKDRQSERERERESAREEARDDAKAAKESAPVKEEVRVKAEEPSTPSEERKRGRGRKRKGDDKEDEPQTPAAAPTPAVVAKAEPAQVADEDTMTGQSTLDESDEEDAKSLSKGGKSVDESNIKVGDGLKVKYGRGRQLKVYEAKVLKVEVDASTGRNKYFVHYSGWNSRYDEWIKKSRIVNVLRDRSPSRRRTATGGSSSKAVTKRGSQALKETTPTSATAPTGSQSSSQSSSAGNTTPATTTTSTKSVVESAPVPPLVGPPVLTSQSSVSSTHSNDSALDGSVASSTATAAVSSQSPGKQSQTTPAPKRGRPPNSGKSAAKAEVTVKEEPKSQSDKHLQQSPQSSAATAPATQTPTPSTPVGRRGRPPLSVKKEKFTRSKSVNEDQSTNDSMATSVSNAEDVPTVAPTVAKTSGDESKKSAKQQLLATASGGGDESKSEVKAVPEAVVKSTRGVQPPDLHDDNTVESKLLDDTDGTTDAAAADHHRQQQHKRGHPLDERLGAVIKTEPLGDECSPKATPKGHAVESETDRSTEAVDTKPEPKSSSGTEDFSSPVKDAFDFDDDEEELAKEEEPLKEQLKKKRKSKDSGSRSAAAKSSSHVSERGDRSAKESATGDETATTDTGREGGSARSGGSSARKSSKKTRKSASESSSSTAAADKSSPDESTAEDVKPMKATAAAVIVTTPESVATVEDKRVKQSTKTVSTPTTRPEPSVQHSSPASSKSEPKKRKGRKRKDEEEVSPPPSVVTTPVSAVAPPLKKRQINKPSKLDLSHEEDSNLEVQKLFEQSVPQYGSGGVGGGGHHHHHHQPVGQLSTSSSTPPQRHESADVSPMDDMKVLPNFTKDIHPTQTTTTTAINVGITTGAVTAGGGAQHLPPADPLAAAATDFLLCEEAVPASPEKCPHPDDHPLVMDTDSQSSPAQHSSPYHSTPTQSPEAVTGKDGQKLGSGSNSEMENETPMMSGGSSGGGKDQDHHHRDSKANVSMPSPAHDEDSMISRPDCNKSPVSPKKRRRGRVRTTSQSESSHTKERIGCKTRGSTGRHRADRHSPLTALEHRLPFSMSQISFNDFVPECKYNFCAPLDQSADPDRRICILQERLQELRKTYVNIKNEVSILDRKKKKARRKERERKEANGRHSAGVGAGGIGADHHMGRGMGSAGSGTDLTNTTCAITAATATLRATGAAAHHSSAHLSAAAAVAALATCSGAGGPYVS